MSVDRRTLTRSATWLARAVAAVVAGALLLTAVVVGMAPSLWSAANAHEETPVTLPPFEDLAQRTYVYDTAMNEIAVYELENSQPITIDQVPDDVVEAFLAVEDREFYRHHGVNVRSLVRALLSNFESGSGRQGASTITQQVAKVEYLAGLERDGRYKLLQAHYALMLEKELSKDEILERYLNTIYLGNNAYGLQAAAEVYFGKRVEELSMVEGAFLAGLVRAPSTYDPIREPEASRRRFEQVLQALVDDGLLSSDRADRLATEWELPEVVKAFPDRSQPSTHFTQAVKDYLLNRSDILGDTYQERYNALFRGGLRIYTTLDPALQAQAELARQQQLPLNSAGVEASLVTLDTQTGAVRAMLGGRPFEPGRNEVNLALRTRQTGSSIKLFILAAAMQAGAQADDLIDGSLPCVLPNPGNPDEPFAIQDGVSRAVSPLEQMTWYSINCAYARLAQIVGLDRVVDTIYRMASSPYLAPGIPGREQIMPYASLATGANEMSALDMASGAQTIANEGVHEEPFLVQRIESPQGVIYDHDAAGTQVLSRVAALRTVDVLKGVLRYGTGRRAAMAGSRAAAGKTGTQDENTNAWFVGFTPTYTTAVWVGNPDRYLPMVNIPEFRGVPRVQGGTYPALIWKAFMDAAHYGVPLSDWDAPPPEPRTAMRLFLPGDECLGRLSVATVPPTVPPADPEPSALGRAAVTGSAPPTAGSRPSTTTGRPSGGGSGGSKGSTTSTSTTTTAPPLVLEPLDSGTTIPTGVTDPTWPLVTTPIDAEGIVVYKCAP